ncbi:MULTISPECIES: phosphotransferase family protein [Pseudonocardia]|uniref:Acyl-CoA dehydrogenase n=2 Tax=Pseudonocardia TaxID=1847 RepID=A0ABQ0S918_9PSEU|nr:MULTISPECIES: phosphotransferase family protein [Pseudonocardia]OSY34576.1 putative aminoglycoside phosphotransferase [Pseudonocardia autotrophica]TDN71835.1 aminoglycoside phosphotransferase (APT) family kinase protein [Pseudonocardia autotrophica]BBG02523.1 acyl-CoA dehydrogenase [Pseudonocardia autotrophica]GEC29423.1 acyl-CoA dehydrogenase [Pseudonocardia saturnea]
MGGAEPDRPAGIDPARVGGWLTGNVAGLVGPVEFALVAGGRSNLTHRVTDAAGATYALRRPPTGGVLSTAHDMGREWRFLCALEPTAVPVPRPLAFCADPAVTGAEFYVMEFVEGTVLADAAAGSALGPAACRRAGEQTVDVLVALHALDPARTGLGDLVRRTGYLQRQLRRWHAQLHSSADRLPRLAADLALLDEVHDLLLAHVPEQTAGIVHGDYRPGNAVFGADGTLLAVLDWELATTGDPMADLGWLVSGWQHPGEDLVPTTDGPSTAPGFGLRDELVRRYADGSGRDVADLPYWTAFARWRAACISAGVQARYLAGHMADDGHLAEARSRGEHVTRLGESARAALRGPDI